MEAEDVFHNEREPSIDHFEKFTSNFHRHQKDQLNTRSVNLKSYNHITIKTDSLLTLIFLRRQETICIRSSRYILPEMCDNEVYYDIIILDIFHSWSLFVICYSNDSFLKSCTYQSVHLIRHKLTHN